MARFVCLGQGRDRNFLPLLILMIIVDRIFPNFTKNWLLQRNGEKTHLFGVFNELIMMPTFFGIWPRGFFHVYLLSSSYQTTI